MKYLFYLLFLLASPLLTAQDRAFLLDFGPNDGSNGNATSSPDANGNTWVSPTDPTTSAGSVSLIDINGTASPIELTITSAFSTNGINHGGLLAPATGLLGEFAIPTATQDYFFTNATAEMKFSGLDPTKGYRFTLFSSRDNVEVRESGFVFSGANEVSGSLQASGPNLGGGGYNGNNSSVYVSEVVFPSVAGEISLVLSRVSGQFAYINLLKIVELGNGNGTSVTSIMVAGDDITEQTDGRIWNNLGLILQLYGNLEPALSYFKKSLLDDIKQQNRSGEGSTLNNMATLAHAQGDYATALRYLTDSLKIQQDIGDRSGEGTTMNNISQIYKAQGDYATALRYLTDSLKIRQDIGDRSGEGTTLHNIGTLLYQKNKFEAAIPPLVRAYQILSALDSPNKKHPEAYLNAIIEKIGKACFEEIFKSLPPYP